MTSRHIHLERAVSPARATARSSGHRPSAPRRRRTLAVLVASVLLASGLGTAHAQATSGDRAYRVTVEHAETGITYVEDWRLLLREDGTVEGLAFEDTDNQLSDRMRFFRAIARLQGTHDGTTFEAQGSVVGMATLWAAEDSPGGVRLVECPIVEATVRWTGSVTDEAATVHHTAQWDHRCIDDVGSAALDPAVADASVDLPRVAALPDDGFAFAPTSPGAPGFGDPSAQAGAPEVPLDRQDPSPDAPAPGGFGTGQAPTPAVDPVADDAAAGGGAGPLAVVGIVVVALTGVGVLVAIRLARGVPSGTSGVDAAAGSAQSVRRRVMMLAGLGVWTLLVGAMVGLAGGGAAFVHYLSMLALVMFVGATVSTARGFRRARSMSRRTLLVMAVLPVTMALLQIAVNGQARAVAALVGLPLGVLAGVAWALATKVEQVDGHLRVAGTVPALIVWAVLVGLTQVVRLVGTDVPGLLLTIVVAQSTAFGVWALVVLRRGTRDDAVDTAAPPEPVGALAGSGREAP